MFYEEERKFGNNKEKLDKLITREKNKKDIEQNIKNEMNLEKIKKANFKDKILIQPMKKLGQNLINSTNQIVPVNLINTGTKKIFNWLGIPMIYDEMIYYSKWWKFYDNCITVINLFIILLAFYDYEINFSYPRQIIAEYNSIRLLMITLAFISIFCVFRRHYMRNKWKNIRIVGNTYEDNSYSSSGIEDFLFDEDSLVIGGKKEKLLSPRFYFDIIINLLLPYPGLDFRIPLQELDRDANKLITIDYLFSDFIYIVILLRSLYLFRAYVNYSILSDHYAYKVCSEYKVQNNFRFAVKCLLKIYHIKVVMYFFLFSVLILGFMMRIFERPMWVEKGRIEFDSFLTPMWCTFVTMMTIGFGDFAPLTLMGKFIGYIVGLWGVFISSLIIVCLQGLLDLSNDQFLVFTKILKSRVAVKFIESAFDFHKSRFLISKKNLEITKEKYKEMFNVFNEFKNMRNESKSIYRSNGLLHYNMKLLKEMKKLNQRMDKLEIDLDVTKKRV